MQLMKNVFIGAAEPVTQAVAKVITHLQPGSVEVPEKKKEGPVQVGSFWGMRWNGSKRSHAIPRNPSDCCTFTSKGPGHLHVVGSTPSLRSSLISYRMVGL